MDLSINPHLEAPLPTLDLTAPIAPLGTDPEQLIHNDNNPIFQGYTVAVHDSEPPLKHWNSCSIAVECNENKDLNTYAIEVSQGEQTAWSIQVQAGKEGADTLQADSVNLNIRANEAVALPRLPSDFDLENMSIVDEMYEDSVITMDIDAEDKGFLSKTKLHIAAESNQPEALIAVLDDKADTEAKGSEGRTALHIATENGWLYVMSLLYLRTANIEAKTNLGLTPLHIAAQRGIVKPIECLTVGMGANVNVKVEKTVTKDGMLITKTLLSSFKSLPEGFTPLHTAAYYGNMDAFNFLLSLDADLEAEDEEGHTALDILENMGHSFFS